MKVIYHLVSALMIIVLSAALIYTCLDWEAFEMRLLKTSFIPIALVAPLKWLIPASEILLIGGFLFFPFRRIVWIANTGLHSMISLYLFLHITSAEGIPCGCGGIFPDLSIHQHLYLQLFLFLTSVILSIMVSSSNSPKPLSPFRRISTDLES